VSLYVRGLDPESGCAGPVDRHAESVLISSGSTPSESADYMALRDEVPLGRIACTEPSKLSAWLGYAEPFSRATLPAVRLSRRARRMTVTMVIGIRRKGKSAQK
jgi:hypothetical protein